MQDPALRNKWQQCRRAVQQEAELVREITREKGVTSPTPAATGVTRQLASLKPPSAAPHATNCTPNGTPQQHRSPAKGSGATGAVGACASPAQQSKSEPAHASNGGSGGSSKQQQSMHKQKTVQGLSLTADSRSGSGISSGATTWQEVPGAFTPPHSPQQQLPGASTPPQSPLPRDPHVCPITKGHSACRCSISSS